MTKQLPMINRALKMLRKYHNLTPTELSSNLGISKSAIWNVEGSSSPVSINMINKYAEFFKLPVSSIMLFAEVSYDKRDKIEATKSFLTDKALRILEWIADVEEFERE